jgi:hypothetical protein
MESSVALPPTAWQPLTPRGVAAFARASLGRLLLMQVLVALLVLGAVLWFLTSAWFPTVRAGIDRLPMQGAIISGRMNWSGDAPQSLAESRFLAFAVDLNHEGRARSPAHIQVEFGQNDVRIFSLFGCLQAPYPKSYRIAFNLQELKPWWGAWEPAILAIAAGSVLLSLFLAWAVLATLYCIPAWLLGLYLDRALAFCGSWRMAGAALMPGALVLSGAIGLYCLGGMDVVRLVTAFVLHLVLGWVYLILGALATPKLQSSLDSNANPFTTTVLPPDARREKSQESEPSNPFRPSGD